MLPGCGVGVNGSRVVDSVSWMGVANCSVRSHPLPRCSRPWRMGDRRLNQGGLCYAQAAHARFWRESCAINSASGTSWRNWQRPARQTDQLSFFLAPSGAFRPLWETGAEYCFLFPKPSSGPCHIRLIEAAAETFQRAHSFIATLAQSRRYARNNTGHRPLCTCRDRQQGHQWHHRVSFSAQETQARLQCTNAISSISISFWLIVFMPQIYENVCHPLQSLPFILTDHSGQERARRDSHFYSSFSGSLVMYSMSSGL